MQIYATHTSPHKRKYRVNGLTNNGASTQTFPYGKNGNTIMMTVKDYFEQEKNVSLRYKYDHFYFEQFYFFLICGVYWIF